MRIFAVVLLGLRFIAGTDLPHLYQINLGATVFQVSSAIERTIQTVAADSIHASSSCKGCTPEHSTAHILTLLRLAIGCGNVVLERMMSVPAPVREHCTVMHQIWQMAWFQEKNASRLNQETRVVTDHSLQRSVVLRQ